jgi:hypothetical protein
MAQLVCMGATLQCSFGAAPSSLIVTPENLVNATSKPAATIMDNIPAKNIVPFGMCSTQSNPAVAAATAAKLGVATPAPCVPVTTAPWVPGSATVMIKNKPALSSTSKLMCTWGGVIQVTMAGQMTVNVP